MTQLPEEAGFQGALALSDSGIIYASQGRGSYFIDVSTGGAVKITDSQYFFVRGNHVVTNDADEDKSAPDTILRIFDLAPGDLPGERPAPLHNLDSSTASAQPGTRR